MNQARKKFLIALTAAAMTFAAPAHAQSISGTVALQTNPEAVAVDVAANKVYVVNFGSASVSVIDGNTHARTNITVGDSPKAIALDPKTRRAYVANRLDNSVTVINTATGTTSTVSVGAQPVAVAINPATNNVYVANGNGNSVSVINGATLAVSTLTVGNNPVAVAVNANTGKVYVANLADNTVTVIDGATTTTVATGNSPLALSVNAATNAVYVANSSHDTVTVIDGASNAVTATIDVGNEPSAIVANPATNRIYVANAIGDSVSVINGASNSVVATISVGNQPVGLALNAAASRVYVANKVGDSLSVINTETNAVSTLSVGNQPVAVAVNPITNRVYVSNRVGDSLTIVDGAGNARDSTFIGGTPKAVAIAWSLGKAIVANQSANRVSVIELASGSSSNVAAGSSPVAVAVNQATGTAFVANRDSDSVTVVNVAALTASTVAVGTTPSAVAVDAARNKAYVANFGSASLSIIDGATLAVTTVPVGSQPIAVAVDANTNTIFVALQSGGGLLAAVDGTTYAVTTAAVGSAPVAVAVDSSRGRVYVANSSNATISVVNGNTLSVSTVVVGSNPSALDVNTASNRIYVANSGGSTVSVVDGETLAVTAVTVGAQPSSVAVDSARNKAYVANLNSSSITVIDGVSNATSTVAAGSSPQSIAVDAVSGRVVTADYGDARATIVTPASRASLPVTAAIAAFSGDQTNDSSPVVNLGAASSVGTVRGMYYRVGNLSGSWLAAAGADGDFSAQLSSLPFGTHVLYAFSVDGNEAGHAGALGATTGFPLASQVAAYAFTVAVAVDGTPDSFSFASQNDVALNSAITSNAVTIAGINVAVAISVTGGEYSIGCGAVFTSAAGTIASGQSVCVRHTSATANSASVSTTLTVGGVSGTFASTTAAPAISLYALSVARAGTGSGAVTSSPSGISCGATCSNDYAAGTVVNLSAVADAGSVFTGWSGACSGTEACSVTMSAASAVTATFGPAPVLTHVLSVAVTNGAAGSVTGTGIACPGDCTETLDQGTVVALTATPVAGGATFVGWTGDCSGTGACSVTMDAARSVGAEFASAPAPTPTYVLTVTVPAGEPGSVTGTGIDCPGDCTETLDENTSVSLTATPSAGAVFLGWSGACNGSGACTVNMNAAKSVTAFFGYTLTVDKTGSGDGSVSSEPSGISCGATCSAGYSAGTLVTLTATADTHTIFAGWSGACSGMGACTVTLDAAKTVGAAFTNAMSVVTSASDFDGDGISDVLWRNTATGAVYVWFMKDGSFTSTHIMTAPTAMGDRGHGRHQRRQQGRHSLEKHRDRRGLPHADERRDAHILLPGHDPAELEDHFDRRLRRRFQRGHPLARNHHGRSLCLVHGRGVDPQAAQPGRHSAQLGHRRHCRHQLRRPRRHRVAEQRHGRSLRLADEWSRPHRPVARLCRGELEDHRHERPRRRPPGGHGLARHRLRADHHLVHERGQGKRNGVARHRASGMGDQGTGQLRLRSARRHSLEARPERHRVPVEVHRARHLRRRIPDHRLERLEHRRAVTRKRLRMQ